MVDSYHKEMVISGVVRIVSSSYSTSETYNASAFDPETEKQKVTTAIQIAAEEMKKQMHNLSDNLTNAENDIFLTQVFLLEDGELEEAIHEAVDTHCLQARDAVLNARDSLTALFQDIPDDALRSRYYDIDGVCSMILNILDNAHFHAEKDMILVGNTIAPYLFLQNHDRIVGCVSTNGSAHSHVSMICRSMGIPYLSDIPILPQWDYERAYLDWGKGTFSVGQNVYEGRILATGRESNAKVHSKLPTTVKIKANLHNQSESSDVAAHLADGIGLVRTEFLFMEVGHIPTLNEQIRIYTALSQSCMDAPVNIRLLDIGDEKQLPFFQPPKMMANKDHRAIRVLLSEPSLLRTQMEAILCANTAGNLRILIPFVTSPMEVQRVKAEIRTIIKKTHGLNSSQGGISVGAMIETPAAVMMIDEILHEVDFISIGSNDLLYSLYVVDRMNPNAIDYIDTKYSALLKAIEQVTSAAHAHGKPVCICGDMACRKEMIGVFIKMGIDELSVPISMLSQVRSWAYQAENPLELQGE